MTDTPTPPMTPEQRAVLVYWLRRANGGTDSDDVADMEAAADQLEADGVTIATLTAERDTAQDRAYRLAVAIMGGEDAPGLADSLPTETLETLARSNFQKHSEDIDRLIAAQAEIARLTAALATAREDGMRKAAKLLILTGPADYDEYDLAGRQSKGFDMGIDWSRETILSAITKGAAT